MAYEQRDMSGALFNNKDKKTDNHPGYTGNCMINGQEFRVAAWVKTPKKGGDKFLSLAFSLPREKKETSPEFELPDAAPAEDTSDLPF